MAITIQQFFGGFLDGCRRQHIDTLEECFSLPCLIATRDDQTVLSDREQLRSYCQRMIDQIAAENRTVERFTVRSLLLLGDEFAIANIAWSMLGGNRSLRTFHTAYNVRRHGGDWAIWAITAHEQSPT